MNFRPDQFTPTKFTPADQKAKFANHFVKFVSGGFAREQFPHWFYQELRDCFGHIAHYNQAGFYDEQFSTPARRLQCVRQWLAYPCSGQPTHTHCDVEAALIDWLRAANIEAQVAGIARRAEEQAELAELARLQRKYPQHTERAA